MLKLSAGRFNNARFVLWLFCSVDCRGGEGVSRFIFLQALPTKLYVPVRVRYASLIGVVTLIHSCTLIRSSRTKFIKFIILKSYYGMARLVVLAIGSSRRVTSNSPHN